MFQALATTKMQEFKKTYFQQGFVFRHCLLRRKQKAISFVIYWPPGNTSLAGAKLIFSPFIVFCFVFTLFWCVRYLSLADCWRRLFDNLRITYRFFSLRFWIKGEFSLPFSAFKSFLRDLVLYFAVNMLFNLGLLSPFTATN